MRTVKHYYKIGRRSLFFFYQTHVHLASLFRMIVTAFDVIESLVVLSRPASRMRRLMVRSQGSL